MPSTETRSGASLLDMQDLRAEDGPPLPLAGDMCRTSKLQGLPAFPHLHDPVLLRLLRSVGVLGLPGDSDRWGIHGSAHAGELCDALCDLWHHWVGARWFHGLAHIACFQRTDYDRVLGNDEISLAAA